jgi:transcription elongation factor Elf1
MTIKNSRSSPKLPQKALRRGRQPKVKLQPVAQESGEPKQRLARGFACPVCGIHVPISLRSFVANGNVQCANPECGTVFSATGAESLKVIDALKSYVHKLE